MDFLPQKGVSGTLDFPEKGLISSSCRVVQDPDERDCIWDTLCRQNRHSVILYDIPPQHLATEGKKAWDELTGQNAWLFALEFSWPALSSPFVGAIAWVNGFMGRCAQVHFSPLARLPMPLALQAGYAFLDYTRATQALDSLLGFTPSPYKYTLRFVEALGFKRLGTLPGACFLARRGPQGVYADGVFSVFAFV